MGNVPDQFPEDRTPEEQIAWLRQRIDAIEARYEARVRTVEARQEEIEQRVLRHERRLDEHERRLARIEAQVDAIRRGEAVCATGDEGWDGFQTRH